MKKIAIKEIPGHLTYFITKRGRVFHKTSKGLYELKVSINPITQRPQVHLKGHSKPLHRLVAITWIPNPNNYPCVCHKDNNILNNRAYNLYWGTHQMNTQQCIREGRFRPKGKIPKTLEEQKAIVKDYQQGLTNAQIKEKWDIGVTQLNKICSSFGIDKKTGDVRKLTHEQEIELIRLHKEGWTRLKLANTFGISRAGVGNYLRRANIIGYGKNN